MKKEKIPLAPREQQIFDWIKRYKDNPMNKNPNPSQEEIAAHFSLSTVRILKITRILKKKGWIKVVTGIGYGKRNKIKIL